MIFIMPRFIQVSKWSGNKQRWNLNDCIECWQLVVNVGNSLLIYFHFNNLDFVPAATTCLINLHATSWTVLMFRRKEL